VRRTGEKNDATASIGGSRFAPAAEKRPQLSLKRREALVLRAETKQRGPPITVREQLPQQNAPLPRWPSTFSDVMRNAG